MMHPVARTTNNMMVFIDLADSEAAAQISRQPYLLSLASTLLVTSDISGSHIWVEKDLGHTVGLCDVIETNDTDIIYYAQRLKSSSFTRFVKNRKLELTSFISIELVKRDENVYDLRQLIFGHPLPAVPSDDHDTASSRKFWTNHALLWGDWPVKSNSVTKDCPW